MSAHHFHSLSTLLSKHMSHFAIPNLINNIVWCAEWQLPLYTIFKNSMLPFNLTIFNISTARLETKYKLKFNHISSYNTKLFNWVRSYIERSFLNTLNSHTLYARAYLFFQRARIPLNIRYTSSLNLSQSPIDFLFQPHHIIPTYGYHTSPGY
jgi:hypothetical protein